MRFNSNVVASTDDLRIVPDQGLYFNVTKALATFKANWSYAAILQGSTWLRFNASPYLKSRTSIRCLAFVLTSLFSDFGDAVIKVSQLDAAIQVNVTTDSKGYPVLNCALATINLGHLGDNINSCLSLSLLYFLTLLIVVTEISLTSSKGTIVTYVLLYILFTLR